MLVFNDDDLTVLTMVLDQIVVEALFQVCTFQSDLFVTFRFEIGKQRGVENNKTRMR